MNAQKLLCRSAKVCAAILLAGVVPILAQTPVEDAIRPLRILVPATPNDDGERTVAVWRDGARSRIKASSKFVPDGLLLTGEASCTAGSVLVVESSNTIAAASLDGACSDIIQLSPLLRTSMKAEVSAPVAAKVPSSATVRAAQCGGASVAMEIPVSIVGSKIVTGVPVGCKVLSLRVAGFAPARLPTLRDQEMNTLGTIALKAGAAVALRIRSGRDGEVLPKVRVTAVRAHELAETRGELNRDSLAVAEALTDASGWARFDGLPEERLFFLLHSGDRTYPQVSEPYSFPAGEETIVDDLVLESASNIVVTVAMAKSLIGSLQLHNIEVHPTGHNHWPRRAPLKTVVTPEGAVVQDVPPGSWRVVVAGRLRNGFAVTPAEATVEVGAGTRADQHVTLHINDTVYRGRLTRRKAPVQATINLRPAAKDRGGRGAVARTNAEGEFEVLLQSPGDYIATIQDAMGGTVKLSRPISFSDGEKTVVVELPPGRVRGRVVNAAGAPVGRVAVTALQQNASPAGDSSRRSAPDGTFELESVATGTWDIIAESDAARSEPVTIAVGDSIVEGVTLVVHAVEKVPVRVIDATGAPMGGAVVIARFPRADRAGSTTDWRRANREGVAEFHVSPAQQATPRNLMILTPDEQISCALRQLSGEQSVVVRPTSGELRLTGRRWGADTGKQGWLVSPAGCAVAVPFLAKSEREPSGDQAFVFSKLAAGRWAYAESRTPAELTAVLAGRAATLAPIETFTVAAGVQTRVVLPTER